MEAILYIFSGLPGSGKSTLAKELAKKLAAVYIRIDTVEQSIRDLCNFNVEGEGYRLSYKIAEDNLKIGNNVIADSCNPIKLSRDEWENVAISNNCKYINIEIICSNKIEHKNRVEKRTSEVKNLKLPTWDQVINRKYEKWDKEHITIDTTNKNIEESTNELLNKLVNSRS